MTTQQYTQAVIDHMLAAAAALEQGNVNNCLDSLRKATSAAQALERHVAGVPTPRRGK